MATDLPPLAALRAWLAQHPSYRYTVAAEERAPDGRFVPATMRIAFDAPTGTERVHVERGKGAGADITWSGGTSVVVRAPGILHAVRVRMSVRDPRVLSPRGNDVRSGDFARVAACFAGRPAELQADSPGGHAVVVALIAPRGLRCGDEYGSAAVTEDRLIIDRSDGHPLGRERLEAGTVVERWRIEDVRGGSGPP